MRHVSADLDVAEEPEALARGRLLEHPRGRLQLGMIRCDAEAHEATKGTDYPDSVVQIARLAASPRAGDIILSACRDWDFRARYEPIPHVSSHGALHRDHMSVPLLLDRPPGSTPRRTADVFPSALQALGIKAPSRLDGSSFI